MNQPNSQFLNGMSTIKHLIKRLQGGENPEHLKSKLKEILLTLPPRDLANIESELFRERMPRNAIMTLCRLHLDIFQESLCLDVQSIPAVTLP